MGRVCYVPVTLKYTLKYLALVLCEIIRSYFNDFMINENILYFFKKQIPYTLLDRVIIINLLFIYVLSLSSVRNELVGEPIFGLSSV